MLAGQPLFDSPLEQICSASAPLEATRYVSVPVMSSDTRPNKGLTGGSSSICIVGGLFRIKFDGFGVQVACSLSDQ